MKNYRKHIDDLFREKLGRYTETPPADVWDNLDVRLNSLKPTIPGSSYRWLGHMGMVSLIVVLSVSFTRKFISNSSTQTTNTTQTEQPMAQVAASALPVQPNTLDANAAPADAKEVQIPNNNNQIPNNNNDVNSNTGNNDNQANDNQPGKEAAATGKNNEANYQSGKKQIAVVTKHANALNKQATVKVYNSTGNPITGTAAKNPSVSNYNSAAAEPSENTADQKTTATGNQSAATTNEVTTPAAAKTQQAIPGTFKKDDPATTKKNPITQPKEKHTFPAGFKRWDAGVKGGYERGFDNIGADKFVIAPYVQYNISPKVAIMVQPAVKFAKSNTRTLGADQTYYQENQDGKVTQNGPSTIFVTIEGSAVDTTYHTKYNYSQTHDSIVKSNTYGGTYMEYEFPVLLKYNLTPKASVYGGLNIIYSQTKGVTEHTNTSAGIVKSVDTMLITTTLPTAPALSDIITYNGTPYSNYNGPLYPTVQESQIRFGAMLGFSYEYSKRWLFDALIQQNPAKTDLRAGYNINAPLSSTYFRLSVGYKLTK